MEINYLAVILASLLQFIIGAVWYTFIFGKTWMKIHGADKYTKQQQKEMMSGVGAFYALQFVLTVVTTVVLALFITVLPDWNAYGIAFFFWLGFVLPTQVSAVLFGGTDKKWMLKKIGIMAGAALTCLLVAAAVLHAMLSTAPGVLVPYVR